MKDPEYHSREKITHKMTRHGLVEQNQTAGTERRVSRRALDAAFAVRERADSPLGRIAQARGHPGPVPNRKKRRYRIASPGPASEQEDRDVGRSALPKEGRAVRRDQREEGNQALFPPSSLEQKKSGDNREYRFQEAPARFSERRKTRTEKTESPAQRGRLKFEVKKETGPKEKKGAWKADKDRQRIFYNGTNRPTDGPREQPVSGPEQDKRRERQKQKTRRMQALAGKADERLKKARSAVPAQRHRRLHFEWEAGKEACCQSAGVLLQAAEGEGERDDSAQYLDMGARGLQFLEERFKRGREKRRERPVKRLARAERRSAKAHAKLQVNRMAREKPELNRQPLKKLIQKKRIQRQYQKKFRQNGSAAIRHSASLVGRAVSKLKNAVFVHKGAVAAAALVILTALYISMGLSSCGLLLGEASTAFVTMTYPAENEEIDEADLYWTSLETEVVKEWQETPEQFPGYDEYRLEGDAPRHDPFQLIAFLSAMYEDFHVENVKEILDGLFPQVYEIETEPLVEMRSYIDEDGNEIWYEWHVLAIRLLCASFEDVVTPILEEQGVKDMYDIYMESRGVHQIYGNPFSYDWKNSVSSLYGYRIDPISGEYKLHKGLDIAAPEGTPIRAVERGTVTEARFSSSYGNVLTIRHENGTESKYAHCLSLLAATGQQVEMGDVIALVGSTGDSTGNHLHIELSKNGRLLNPIFLLEYMTAKEDER